MILANLDNVKDGTYHEFMTKTEFTDTDRMHAQAICALGLLVHGTELTDREQAQDDVADGIAALARRCLELERELEVERHVEESDICGAWAEVDHARHDYHYACTRHADHCRTIRAALRDEYTRLLAVAEALGARPEGM